MNLVEQPIMDSITRVCLHAIAKFFKIHLLYKDKCEKKQEQLKLYFFFQSINL